MCTHMMRYKCCCKHNINHKPGMLQKITLGLPTSYGSGIPNGQWAGGNTRTI